MSEEQSWCDAKTRIARVQSAGQIGPEITPYCIILPPTLLNPLQHT